ncbi:MAG: portal protein [Alphaproteobacteria bacterium]
MGVSVNDILRQWDEVAAGRAGFQSVWQEIADHLLGRRDFTGAGASPATPGRKRMARIYDTTGLQAADLLAAALHSFLTNPALRWFGLRPEDDFLAEDDAVRGWLGAAEDVLYAAFNGPDANFAPQIHEVYLDQVAFGTAALYVGDRPGRGLLFSARPLGEIHIAENAEGRVDTVFRRFRFTARQAHQAWGPAAGKAVTAALEAGKGERSFAFLHCVKPFSDAARSGPRTGTRAAFAFGSYYVNLDERALVAAGGYHEMPYMVPRWSKDAGEIYGRAPGWNALPDQKMLNEMSRTTLKAAQKAVDPPLLIADDGVVMPLRTQPGGINVVRAGALSQDPLRPLPAAPRIDIGLEMMEQRREAVRAAFHGGLLQLFQDPRMSATQVLQLVQEMQRLLGPMLGRQQAELLEPMIERVFGILLRAGMLPPLPDALIGVPLRVDHVSPIARAQKAGDAQAVLRTLEAAEAMAAIDPQVTDLIDPDAGLRLIAEANGVPAKALRGAEDVAVMRALRAV